MFVSIWNFVTKMVQIGRFPGGSDDKESACNAGDPGLIPGWGRSPGEGNGNPFQYSCLENPMNVGAWQATVHEVTKSWTWLSHFTFTLWCKCLKNQCLLRERFWVNYWVKSICCQKESHMFGRKINRNTFNKEKKNPCLGKRKPRNLSIWEIEVSFESI